MNAVQNLLILNADEQPFDLETIQQIFESEGGFGSVRFDEAGGALIEATYTDDQDSTFVRLSDSRKGITLTGMTDAALRAALILDQHLPSTLRIVDWDYSFDLILSDFKGVEELRSAIEMAQGG